MRRSGGGTAGHIQVVGHKLGFQWEQVPEQLYLQGYRCYAMHCTLCMRSYAGNRAPRAWLTATQPQETQ